MLKKAVKLRLNSIDEEMSRKMMSAKQQMMHQLKRKRTKLSLQIELFVKPPPRKKSVRKVS